jgi:hypothetical protein
MYLRIGTLTRFGQCHTKRVAWRSFVYTLPLEELGGFEPTYRVSRRIHVWRPQRTGTSWSCKIELHRKSDSDYDYFGTFVAMVGYGLTASAPRVDISGVSDTGAVRTLNILLQYAGWHGSCSPMGAIIIVCVQQPYYYPYVSGSDTWTDEGDEELPLSTVS